MQTCGVGCLEASHCHKFPGGCWKKLWLWPHTTRIESRENQVGSTDTLVQPSRYNSKRFMSHYVTSFFRFTFSFRMVYLSTSPITSCSLFKNLIWMEIINFWLTSGRELVAGLRENSRKTGAYLKMVSKERQGMR